MNSTFKKIGATIAVLGAIGGALFFGTDLNAPTDGPVIVEHTGFPSEEDIASGSIVTSSGVWYRSGSAVLLNPSTLTIGASGSPIADGYFTDLTVSGTCTGCAGSVALDDISDVTITSVGNGEILGYNSGWINRTLSEAGIASSGANSDITSLTGLTTPLGVAYGGTGSTTAQTGGLFFYGGSYFAQDTPNLFWDNTNNVLGIGTSTPWTDGVKLNIYGGALVVDEFATSSLSSVVIDWTEGNQQTITMTQATDIDFENYKAGQVLRLYLCSDGTGRAVSWTAPVLWSGETEPTETATADRCDLFTFNASYATSSLVIFGSSVAF